MRVLFWLSILAILLGIVILATINLWLYWPIRTLEVKNYSDENPIPIKNNIVQPGQALEYELDYCKYFDGDAVVHRTMVDGQVITLQDSAGRLPLGCHKATVKTAVVPPTINPGQYYLDVSVEYKVNPLRTEITHYHTGYFTVVPRSANAPYKKTVNIEDQVELTQ